jgi:peptidoglycan hydrolase-like protein with peptidoglycan-binding domain
MDRLLRLGCAPGSDVAALQTDLNQVQYSPGQVSSYELLVVDGIFGSKTHQRVKEFQRINLLTQDGIAGPNTLNKLHTVLMLQPGVAQQVRGGTVSVSEGKIITAGKPVPATRGALKGFGGTSGQTKTSPTQFGRSPKGAYSNSGSFNK